MENEEYNEMKLQKVPLAKLITILLNLFQNGVEYIDIIGIKDEDDDYVGITFIKEYMTQESRDRYDELIDNSEHFSKINVNPTDNDDLNQLI